MNALVVGGTKGFGLAISTQLQKHGFEVQTIARSNADFICNVSHKKEFQTLLQNTQIRLKPWDCIVCVVGLAHSQNIQKIRQSNFGYVTQIFEKLVQPQTTFICFGSRWQLQQNNTLCEYTKAKRQLAQFITEMANKGFHAIQFIVPPMKTNGFNIAKRFVDITPKTQPMKNVSTWVITSLLEHNNQPIQSWFERK